MNTTWGALVRRPLAFPKGFLDEVVKIIDAKVEHIGRKHAQACRAKFASWVDEAVGQPKLAHQWCRRVDTEEEIMAQQRARSLGHLQAMSQRVSFWAAHWQRHREQWCELQRHINDLRYCVKADFRAEVQQPLEEDALDEALNTYKPDKAKGVDGWSTALLAFLGKDARDELLALLRRCEVEGMWPLCWMATLAKFIPKSDGGERPILLMNLFCRLSVKARGCDLVEWAAARANTLGKRNAKEITTCFLAVASINAGW